MLYHYQYEIGHDEHGIQQGQETVQAVSEERAREYVEQLLEEKYPGENGFSLLILEMDGSHPE